MQHINPMQNGDMTTTTFISKNALFTWLSRKQQFYFRQKPWIHIRLGLVFSVKLHCHNNSDGQS